MPHLSISVPGDDTAAQSLAEWLRREPQSRGKAQPARVPVDDRHLRLAADLAIILPNPTTIVVAPSRAVSTWTTQPGSDVPIEPALPESRKVSVSVKRTRNIEHGIDTALREAGELLAEKRKD